MIGSPVSVRDIAGSEVCVRDVAGCPGGLPVCVRDVAGCPVCVRDDEGGMRATPSSTGRDGARAPAPASAAARVVRGGFGISVGLGSSTGSEGSPALVAARLIAGLVGVRETKYVAL